LKLPRYWRFVFAAVVALLVGAVLRGMAGVLVGVAVAIGLILVIESSTRSRRRP
jgi:hypothetical protein